MFVKAFLVCAVAAVALGIEYPPGIHPAVCPDYPYCDMEVLARHTPQGLPIPDWELPYFRMVAAPITAPIAEPFETKLGAIEYPADVDPALCPNYPYCDTEVLARLTPQGLPIPDWELPYAGMVAAPTAAPIAEPIETKVSTIEYPADVDPAMCPNYPYCDTEVLARLTPQGLPIPDRELPYARMVAAPTAAPIAEPIETKVGAIEYPADVDPASCPNYPYCA